MPHGGALWLLPVRLADPSLLTVWLVEPSTVPTATSGDATLYYETDGSGETVVFVNDAGVGAWLWGWQYPAVAGSREALVWDLRGTGRSHVPPDTGADDPSAGDAGSCSNSSGEYTFAVDEFAADVEAVLAAHGTRRAHLVGAGLGGMIALRYARTYDRAASLVVFDTASSGERFDADFAGFFGDANSPDLTAVVSPEFVERRPDLIERIETWRREDDAGAAVRAAHVDAARSFDAGPLYELTLPVLVFHGVDDPVVSLDAGRELADELPRGRFEPVEGRHFPFVEHSRAVNDELLWFLAECSNE